MTLAVPTKRETTLDRRLEIALAARALIVEKGFEGLRTRDIAERVGINVATLHYHVPSKEALIGLVAESMRDEFRNQALKHPREGLSPLELFRLELRDYRETIETTPELIQAFAELLMRAKRDENIRQVIGPMHSYWVGQFEAILARGEADGSFRPGMDAVAAAHMVTAALKTWRAADKLSAFDQLAAELERAVINPIHARQDDPK